ncbi:MAG: cytochrome c oxidase assembly factor Coa1 family protein [Planctomycetota bacterium]|jgi:hypothetical protein
MVKSLDKTIFGTRAVEFTSDYSLEESVERLAGIVKRSVFSALTRQELVGKVSSDRVSLQRVIPFFGNSFKPFFIGTFHIKEGKIVLRGNFTIHRLVKAFLALWFGFCILWTFISIGAYLGERPRSSLMSFAGLGMLLAGFGIVRFGQLISHGDMAWISKRISEALFHGVEAESISTTQESRSWLGRNWKWLIPVGFSSLVILALVIVTFVIGFIKSTDVYADALAAAKSKPEVIAVIGEPIKEGLFVTGSVSVSGSSGNADLVIPISGPKGKAVVYVVATKSAGKWKYSTLEVVIDKTSERINLLIGK